METQPNNCSCHLNTNENFILSKQVHNNSYIWEEIWKNFNENQDAPNLQLVDSIALMNVIS